MPSGKQQRKEVLSWILTQAKRLCGRTGYCEINKHYKIVDVRVFKVEQRPLV